MVSKKQRFRTVILILIFAVVIVGGVFGISYYKGSLTFPWQVTSGSNENATASKEADDSAVEEVASVEEAKPEPQEEVKQEEPAVAEEEEEPAEVEEEEVEADTTEEDTSVATTGIYLDYYGALHVEDGVLVGEAGQAARLTGVSSHGLSWYPEFVTADAIKALRANLGINVIRLAMYTSDYNGYCVAGDDIKQTLKDNIDEAVQAATESDMYVIIDWHILNDANPNEYKSDAIQFFGELVRKYEDNDNVIYEICNEPNGDTSWDDIKRYANEVIPVIRNVDRDALILVGTPEWSSDLDSPLEDPLDFDNIMYTYHFYAGSHKSSARNALTSALEAGLPVFISEYGFTAADGDGAIDEKEALKWLEVIDEYKLSSCIWNLSNKDEGSALISSDCEKTLDFEYEDYSEQGQYFFDMLATTGAVDEASEAESTDDDATEDDAGSVDTKNNKTSKTRETKKNDN